MTAKERNKKHSRSWRERQRLKGYWVYYIPSINYCGITHDLTQRKSWHKTFAKVDVTGFRILFHSFCRKETAYKEAMFQSVLCMEGLNYK